jgi:hypothetical protein
MVPPKDILTLIANGEGEFDQDILIFCNNFKTKYEQLFKLYNGGQCVMVLIKNVTKHQKKINI